MQMQLRADFSLVTGKRLGWPGKGDRRTNKQTFQQGSTTCRVAVWWLVSIFSGNCSCHWQSPGPHVHAHAIGVVSSSSANYLPLIRSTEQGLRDRREYGEYAMRTHGLRERAARDLSFRRSLGHCLHLHSPGTGWHVFDMQLETDQVNIIYS